MDFIRQKMRSWGPRKGVAASTVVHVATQKAAVFSVYGSIDNVTVDGAHPLPWVEPDEVLVRVRAAAVNPLDWKRVMGFMKLLDKKPPLQLGSDFAGVVVYAGAQCTRLQPGMEVFGMCDLWSKSGSFSQYVSVRESMVTQRPSNLNLPQAASLPLAGMTAYQALFHPAHKIKPGHRVLVIGGSGGVGSLAIQMARAAGAHVVATCSMASMDTVRALGPEWVYDYNTVPVKQVLAAQSYDFVFDTVGEAASWDAASRLMDKKGTFVTIAAAAHKPLQVSELAAHGWRVVSRKTANAFNYGPNYVLMNLDPKLEYLDAVKGMVEKGELRPVIDSSYPLDRVREALQRSFTGHAKGKVVVLVD